MLCLGLWICEAGEANFSEAEALRLHTTLQPLPVEHVGFMCVAIRWRSNSLLKSYYAVWKTTCGHTLTLIITKHFDKEIK